MRTKLKLTCRGYLIAEQFQLPIRMQVSPSPVSLSLSIRQNYDGVNVRQVCRFGVHGFSLFTI